MLVILNVVSQWPGPELIYRAPNFIMAIAGLTYEMCRVLTLDNYHSCLDTLDPRHWPWTLQIAQFQHTNPINTFSPSLSVLNSAVWNLWHQPPANNRCREKSQNDWLQDLDPGAAGSNEASHCGKDISSSLC